MQNNFRGNNKGTSWQKVAPWYNKITEGGQGHYYHQHVVLPGVMKLLDLDGSSKLLDLACGNGVLVGSLPKNIEYLGIDLAADLINQGRKNDQNPKHKYMVFDVTKELEIPNNFTHATIILALQNIRFPEKALQNASNHLQKGGSLVIVLNHPMFRIPRQSSWGTDLDKKIQYRRIDKYMSSMDIPVLMNPSDRNSKTTMSYHNPLSTYSKMLKDAGFSIDEIQEWTSDKESEGRSAKMENRSRNEIPLFMAIRATKNN